jgi:hypothetical protein
MGPENDRCHFSAKQVGLNASAGGFDFGEFWHGHTSWKRVSSYNNKFTAQTADVYIYQSILFLYLHTEIYITYPRSFNH